MPHQQRAAQGRTGAHVGCGNRDAGGPRSDQVASRVAAHGRVDVRAIEAADKPARLGQRGRYGGGRVGGRQLHCGARHDRVQRGVGQGRCTPAVVSRVAEGERWLQVHRHRAQHHLAQLQGDRLGGLVTVQLTWSPAASKGKF